MISKRNAHPTKYKVRYNSEEKFGEEKNKLLEERSELTGEITSVLRDIGHLETELDRLSHDLAETGLHLIRIFPILNLWSNLRIIHNF